MDWLHFLDQHGIDYVTKGPNTKRGEASVQCPFCGEDDPSHHMGISLSSENWGCHRSADHRGKRPYRLVAALLGCSAHRARLLVEQYSRPDPESLADVINLLEGPGEPPSAENAPVTLPAEFKGIRQTGLTSRFWRYLEGRGFDDPAKVSKRYDLYCALTGTYKDRVIIPFYKRGQLVGWTGRAIVNPKIAPRYLSSGEAVKTTIFMEDQIRKGGEILAIVEGPFDALKVDYYGKAFGLRATCVFGTSMTLDQVSLLTMVSKRFNHVYVLFDPEAVGESFAAKDWILGRNITEYQLPIGIEDPGAMTRQQVHELASHLRARI